eukprot:NODE_2141_length_828_cov_126.223363_g1501_i0.p1 GENE.NODE_2141_length_828_cov_126.223363_g1501_i0~~NODE_2141_length_828_cov_126.223363_g1501_i0.p1  ORF type:complete len:191 (+),score=84.96 NODE_2141_length_828_cov_126.223363_g1501_i0:52-573(+)
MAAVDKSQPIYAAVSTYDGGKFSGVGLFAGKAFAVGDVVEISKMGPTRYDFPEIEALRAENGLSPTPDEDFFFAMGDSPNIWAQPPALAAYANHSFTPNIVIKREPEHDRLVITACAPIAVGDEIAHHYGDPTKIAKILTITGLPSTCKCAICKDTSGPLAHWPRSPLTPKTQ